MLELIGFAWAAFAPALLLIPGALLYLAAGLFPGFTSRKHRVLAAAAITLSPVLALWLRDVRRFEARCQALGPAQILERRRADGFFLDDSTANSFGMRYLQDEGFLWLEARSIYDRDRFTRYERTAAGIDQREVDRITATIEVKSEHASDALSSTTLVTISERVTRKVLARAAQSHFNGGGARVVLGAWGARSCPSPLSSAGAEEFNRFYHLAKLTLR